MEKNKKKEDLQSRRQFFKKAAKSALPIVAGMVLAGMPQLMKATEKAPMGCQGYSCQGGCQFSCTRVCNSSCKGTCNDTCYTTCLGSCSDGCYKGCKNLVKYY